MKVSAANDTLAHIIKRKLGNPIAKNKSASSPPQSTSANSVGQRQGVTPQYVINTQETLQQRAAKRRQLTLLRQQQNIETIMALAVEYCPHVSSESEPDPDWIERFIGLAEDTSNQAMQTLWAKILAGETVKPGTFSYKSLLTLKQMTQKEADALQKATSLAGRSPIDNSSLILLGYYNRPSLLNLFKLKSKAHLNLSKCGLSFPNVLTLMDIDVLYQQEIESTELNIGQSYQLVFKNSELTLKAKRNGLILNYYKLTQTGEELTTLSQAHLNPQYKLQLEQVLNSDFEVSWGQ